MQVVVDINLAFGTAKTYKLDRHQVVPEYRHLILQLIHVAQHSYHHLHFPHGKLEIGLVRLDDGANASKGSPVFVYKIKGRVFATDAVLCAPKMGFHNQIHMLL